MIQKICFFTSFFMSFETFQVFCLFIFSDLDKFIENQSKWSFIRALLCEVAIVSVIYWVVLRKNCQVAFVLLNLYSLCLFIIIKHLKKTHTHTVFNWATRYCFCLSGVQPQFVIIFHPIDYRISSKFNKKELHIVNIDSMQ